MWLFFSWYNIFVKLSILLFESVLNFVSSKKKKKAI